MGAPINLLTCTPPKSGTTSWIRGVAVLKDYLKGTRKKPEDYDETKLFKNRVNDAFSPSQFENKIPSQLENFSNVTKLKVSIGSCVLEQFPNVFESELNVISIHLSGQI